MHKLIGYNRPIITFKNCVILILQSEKQIGLPTLLGFIMSSFYYN